MFFSVSCSRSSIAFPVAGSTLSSTAAFVITSVEAVDVLLIGFEGTGRTTPAGALPSGLEAAGLEALGLPGAGTTELEDGLPVPAVVAAEQPVRAATPSRTLAPRAVTVRRFMMIS